MLLRLVALTSYQCWLKQRLQALISNHLHWNSNNRAQQLVFLMRTLPSFLRTQIGSPRLRDWEGTHVVLWCWRPFSFCDACSLVDTQSEVTIWRINFISMCAPMFKPQLLFRWLCQSLPAVIRKDTAKILFTLALSPFKRQHKVSYRIVKLGVHHFFTSCKLPGNLKTKLVRKCSNYFNPPTKHISFCPSFPSFQFL